MRLRPQFSLLAVIALVSTGCGGSESTDRAGSGAAPERRDPVGKKLAQKSDQVSDSDYELIARNGDESQKFTIALNKTMLDYSDPDVSAEAWLKETRSRLTTMRRAVTNVRANNVTMRDGAMRKQVDRLNEDRQDIFDSVTGLRLMVAQGDEAGERRAARAYDAAVKRSRSNAAKILEFARPFYSDDELLRIKERRLKEHEEGLTTP